ncbi:MAG: transposase, partial [Candidatus Binatia bacterium]
RHDTDRTDFRDRLRSLVPATGTTFSAWSLLSAHWHMLARSGPAGIAKTMHRLLGGSVPSFNHRRHHRCGHLFDNRVKSTRFEDESYFLDLLCYIHLNPLRAGIVADHGGSTSRRRDAMIARALVACISVGRCGFTQSAVAHALRVSKQTIWCGVALADQILPLLEPAIIDLLHDDIAAPRPTTAAQGVFPTRLQHPFA